MHNLLLYFINSNLRKLLFICVFSTLNSLAACQPVGTQNTNATVPPVKAEDTVKKYKAVSGDVTGTLRRYSLTLYAYNYTDTSLGSYEADGRGGGNVFLSDGTNGGGSSACCYSLTTPLSDKKTVKIRWLRFRGRTGYWCEKDVPLKGPIPIDAEYLEVHFYLDGHIELAVTADNSPARIILGSENDSPSLRHADPKLNVINDDKFSKCERWIEPGSKEYRAIADKLADEAEAARAAAPKKK